MDLTREYSNFLTSREMMDAMATMDMSAEEQSEVVQVVSGILHLGNVMFREEGNERAVVDTDQCKFGNWAIVISNFPRLEDSTSSDLI